VNQTAIRRLRAPKFDAAGTSTTPHSKQNHAAKTAMGPLADHLGYLLRRAQLAVFKDFFVTFERLDISPVQYSILTVIQQNPGLSQSQVAEALGIKRTNFVAMLDTLEGRDLARRAATERDRRSYALFLTADGEALMRKLRMLASEHEQRLIDRLGAETHSQLFAPLRSLAAMANAEN
jgi:DNA-binding MarR family transcriptional regulator